MNKKINKYVDKVIKVSLSFLILCGLIMTNTTQSQALATSNTTDYPKSDKVEYHGKISYGASTVGNFTINGVQAFCMEHPKTTPSNGTSLTSSIYDNDDVRKVLYYGWGGEAQWSGFDSKAHGIVATSLVLSHYYYGDSIGNAEKSFYDYVKNKTVPKLSINFSKSKAKSYVSGDIQRTETITLNSEATLFSTSFQIQDKVTFVNETTGKKQTGGTVTVKGKDKFHFEAPLNVSLSSWSTGMKTSKCDWMPIVSRTSSSGMQDLGRGEWMKDPSKITSLSIDWLQYGDLEIAKKDDKGNYVPDVTFQVSDKADMSNVIGTYRTDETGKVKTSQLLAGTYYVQEVSAPEHLVIDRTIHKITIAAGKTASFIQTDQWRKARIVLHKRGEVLTGYQEGQFIYEEKALEGAVFDIYASEDIVDPITKEVVYYKDDYVKSAISDGDGKAQFEMSYFGKFYMKEMTSPAGYVLNEEPIFFEFSHENQEEISIVVKGHEIENERQKHSIHITKKDVDTSAALEGVEFGIFSNKDIINDRGEIILEKNVLLETVRTNDEGRAQFQIDTPVDFSDDEAMFRIEELKTKMGYQPNQDSCIFVDTHYTNQQEKVVVFDYNIFNEKIKTDIKVNKIDSYTKESILSKDFSFSMYADKECTQHIKTVQANIKTGIATFEDVTFGTYYIKETKAPEGYQKSEEVKMIVVDEYLEGVGRVYQFDYQNIVFPKTLVQTNDAITIIMELGLLILSGFTLFMMKKKEKEYGKYGIVIKRLYCRK